MNNGNYYEYHKTAALEKKETVNSSEKWEDTQTARLQVCRNRKP